MKKNPFRQLIACPEANPAISVVMSVWKCDKLHKKGHHDLNCDEEKKTIGHISWGQKKKTGKVVAFV